MFERPDRSRPALNETDRLARQILTFTHPDDVLHSLTLTTDDKRAILAAWASDAHAVPDLPAMRQLDSGAIVPVDILLEALRSLDAPVGPKRSARAPVARPLLSLAARWRRSLPRREQDDDDDPPPCPARAAVPRRKHPFVTLGQRLCRA